jgi:hypothetical protein
MKHAYNSDWLENLFVVKEAKQWLSGHVISLEQFRKISIEKTTGFYHPNFMIRLLLFMASIVAIGGITGLVALIIQPDDEDSIALLMVVYGIASFISLDRILVNRLAHYKSGVTEAVLYHSAIFLIGGIAVMSEADNYVLGFTFLLVFAFSAFRYLDLVSTAMGFCALAYLVFQALYDAGAWMQQAIPLLFIVLFTPLYFYFRRLKGAVHAEQWLHCLVLLEALSLVTIYAAGNYLVVRELSTEMLYVYLEDGQDIPLAYVFYALTVVVPLTYLIAGIRLKDVVLLRVSLILLAFSVFTFKYYYSTGHHEITFTIGGAILIATVLFLFRFLKTPRNGYTADNLMKEKWAAANPEAFVISQTMGGNKVEAPEGFKGEGGGFGGGGASATY